jgi:amino acid permease
MAKAKKSQDWYVAASHTITSGFAIPLIIAAAYLYAAAPLLNLDTSSHLSQAIAAGIGVLSIWLGVKYSAVYIRRTYEMDDRHTIANLATVFFVLILALFTMPELFGADVITIGQFINTVGAIISALVFYYASHREFLDRRQVQMK